MTEYTEIEVIKREMLYESLLKELKDDRSLTIPNVLNSLHDKLSDASSKDMNWILIQSVRCGNINIIWYFLKAKIKVGPMNKLSQTAIHVASGDPCNHDICNLLFNVYDDFNYITSEGLSHFHIACMLDDVSRVKKFIDQGVDINLKDELYQLPPLFHALHFDKEPKVEMVELLLKNGADPNALDQLGSTALHQICSLRPESEKSSENQLKIIRLLMKHNVDVNAQNFDGYTALHTFLEVNEISSVYHLDIVQILITVDNAKLLNFQRQTPLHCMIQKNLLIPFKKKKNEIFFDVIQLLLSHGVPINELDENGSSALSYAITWCDYDSVKWLLEHDADMDYMNLQGGYFDQFRTLEMTQNILEIVKLLEQELGHPLNIRHEAAVLEFLIDHDCTSPLCVTHYGMSHLETGDLKIIRKHYSNIFETFHSDEIRKKAQNLSKYLKIVQIGNFYIRKELHDFLSLTEQNIKEHMSYENLNELDVDIIKEEIQRAKLVMISEKASLYDVCTSDPRKVVLRDFNHESTFDYESILKEFPHTAGIMKGYITKILICTFCKRFTHRLKSALEAYVPEICTNV